MNTTPGGARRDFRHFSVDGWLVQPDLNRLVGRERSVHVRPQLIDLLACLAVRPGAVVSKDQLLATVWNDRYVAESGIARCVAELRQILADDAKQPRIIETIPKRGYRLIARVERAGERVTPAAADARASEPVGPDVDRPVTPGAPEMARPDAGTGVADRARGFSMRARAVLSAAAGLLAAWRH